jgi:hypothetical protein
MLVGLRHLVGSEEGVCCRWLEESSVGNVWNCFGIHTQIQDSFTHNDQLYVMP